MIGALVQLLILVLVAGLIVWVVQQLSPSPIVTKVVIVVVSVIVIIWLIYFLTGFIPAGGPSLLPPYRR